MKVLHNADVNGLLYTHTHTHTHIITCIYDMKVLHNADVNCEDRWGNRPLRDAKAGGHQEVIR